MVGLDGLILHQKELGIIFIGSHLSHQLMYKMPLKLEIDN